MGTDFWGLRKLFLLGKMCMYGIDVGFEIGIFRNLSDDENRG